MKNAGPQVCFNYILPYITLKSSYPNQTTNNKLTFNIYSSPSSMVILSSFFFHSLQVPYSIVPFIHSFTDLFTSYSFLRINIKPKPILTTTQTHFYHPRNVGLGNGGPGGLLLSLIFFFIESKDSKAICAHS